MNARGWRWLATPLFLALIMFAAGCAGPLTKYYLLSPIQKPEQVAPAAAAGTPAKVLAVGPVTIPDYVDRPHLIVRESANQMEVKELSRWAGSIQRDVTRVLMENLSLLLPKDEIAVVPWRSGIPARGRLAVDIIRFDITPKQDVTLSAQWALFSAQNEKVTTAAATFTQPVKANQRDTAAMVEAMSEALAQLSRAIAADAGRMFAEQPAETGAQKNGQGAAQK